MPLAPACAGRGATPLHLACTFGSEGCVALLLVAKAHVDAVQDGDPWRGGDTALRCAINANEGGCVRLLVAHDADVNKADGQGLTPLYVFCRLVPPWPNDTARVLVQAAGCRVNYRCGKIRFTALHAACAAPCDVETVRVLLEGGADRFARSVHGVTAREMTQDTAVLRLFDSGADYWRRARHACHSRSMRAVVRLLLLVRLRLAALAGLPSACNGSSRRTLLPPNYPP